MTLRHADRRRPTLGDDAAAACSASPNICSRRWIWEQYDHQVMLNTVVLPGSDAAVLRIGDDRPRASRDRRSRLQRPLLLPRPVRGRADRVRRGRAQRRVLRRRPAAITDCLNFGNPEKPEVFWTFYESVRGLADACKAFGRPGHLAAT